MKKKLLYTGCFMLAFFLRVSLVYLTPDKNNYGDLQIYRSTGKLVANGVNPYNFNDNVELREQLRIQSTYHNPIPSLGSWNYYANSNLPLATLFFGAVEHLFSSSLAYRLFFAFFDSLLAVVVLAFVLNKWKFRLPENFISDRMPPKLVKYLPLLIGFCLGALSPVLLLNGTVLPEHKGTGLLLILSAIYFSDSSKKINSMCLSPILLGCSVSFIGLGVYIAPLCLYNIYKETNFKSLLLYSFIAFTSCVIWLLPFLPELVTMMSGRLTSNRIKFPIHASLWVIFYKIIPTKWMLVKNIFITLFIGINIIGFVRKRLNMAVISASLIYLFTVLYLIDSSMNRLNIALLTVILLLGYAKFFNMAILLSALYVIHGSFTFLYATITRHTQSGFDGIFVLLFSVLYFLFLVVQTFNSQQITNETKHSYSRL